MTYFELFDISPSFDVDLQQLKIKYRQLQTTHHPDKNIDLGLAGQSALAQSANINQAYHTLVTADSRAAYLLKLHKQDNGLENSIGDLDFLQHALELREQLEEASSSNQLASLRIEIQQWLDSLSREFKLDFIEKDWTEARDTTRKLRFIQRVLMDIDKAEDRFDAIDQDLDTVFDDEF